MPARRWILVPVPHPGSLAPILAAIAILAGVALVAFALALGPGSAPPTPTIAPSSVRPATGPPADPVPADTLAPPRKASEHAGRWM